MKFCSMLPTSCKKCTLLKLMVPAGTPYTGLARLGLAIRWTTFVSTNIQTSQTKKSTWAMGIVFKQTVLVKVVLEPAARGQSMDDHQDSIRKKKLAKHGACRKFETRLCVFGRLLAMLQDCKVMLASKVDKLVVKVIKAFMYFKHNTV